VAAARKYAVAGEGKLCGTAWTWRARDKASLVQEQGAATWPCACSATAGEQGRSAALGDVTARAAAQHGPGARRLRENEDETKLALLVVERKGA
jgi:hypothetical protein